VDAKGMNNQTTIIYYTANREHPGFAARVVEDLINASAGLPIISVSHKPMNLGTNICVGDQPLSYSNVLRQTLIGLKAAKTNFCIAAEDDCLYPPEYFQFTPATKTHVYRYSNVVVHFERRNRFWAKNYVEAAQMAGRKFWIRRIEKILKGHDSWEPIPVNPPYVFTTRDMRLWRGKSPVIYFKTKQSFRFKTTFFRGAMTQIPYWGTAEEVYNTYLR